MAEARSDGGNATCAARLECDVTANPADHVSDYDSFLTSKSKGDTPTGIAGEVDVNTTTLFPFQQDIVRWALRRGRAAIWADCGLGKTRMALEWAAIVHEYTCDPVLILTPLAVARQFYDEGVEIGVTVTVCREAEDLRPGINVTNYERLGKFDASIFGAVVLDESSILKDYSSKTRGAIIDAFGDTPFRLACTATPSPNDMQELGNHAEFLGVMTRVEMLASFFVHDGGSTQNWRLKGHAQGDFWKWISSWAVALRKPSDIGHSDDGYDLPPLNMTHHTTDSDMTELAQARGRLFADSVMNLHDQRTARRISIADRVAVAANLVNASDQPWVVWCDLNAESSALAAAIPDAIEVRGSDKPDSKENAILSFSTGASRVIVTKPSICGWGVNWQHCAHSVFVGVTHSFEAWYQAIRRSYRFGQTRPVECHVVTSSAEQGVIDSLARKRDQAETMIDSMAAAFSREWDPHAIHRQTIGYSPNTEMVIPSWVGKDG